MLVHDRRGAGPALVLIHGIGARRGAWDPVVERLAGERETIAIDLPGFGESPPLPLDGDLSIDRYVDAVERFLAGAGLDRPHVAGNSMGGGIALELARRGTEVEIFTRATSSDLPPVAEAAPGVLVRHVVAGPFEGLDKHDLPTQLCPFTAAVLRT